MTTPRDAIGLSERLRDRFTVGAYVQPTHLHCPDYSKGRALLEEAATALDALQARVAELTDLLATGEDLRRQAKDVAEQWQARATRAEQERGEWRTQAKYETDVAQAAVEEIARLRQERDEAYEHLATILRYASRNEAGPEIAAARDLVRRLAAGTEKEGK
jgi:DNA repair exonuclease SbcCD ATPase subunit